MKSGRALWSDDTCDADFLLSTSTNDTSEFSTPIKNESAEGADLEQAEGESEEGQLLDELETPQSIQQTKSNATLKTAGKPSVKMTTYRKLVTGQGVESGKKRMRPAYDHGESDALDEISDTTIADAVTTVSPVKKSGARSAKKVTKYVEAPEYESEEGEGVEAVLV